ncbi:MAG: hypothetical protein ACRD3W_16785, partial [Terriglobales bacterium]
HVNAPISVSTPDRFFDSVSANYYVTDNLKFTVGHLYLFGRHSLNLSAEQGFPLGSGRMASLFTTGLIGENGAYAVLGGLRIYFGQHDKTLIDRNRQDDPPAQEFDTFPLKDNKR